MNARALVGGVWRALSHVSCRRMQSAHGRAQLGMLRPLVRPRLPARQPPLISPSFPLCALLTRLQTAHVGALYSAFLAMMLATGVPPVIAALSLGFMSNLFGSITHFGSGQAAVYYGAGAALALKEKGKMGRCVCWGVCTRVCVGRGRLAVMGPPLVAVDSDELRCSGGGSAHTGFSSSRRGDLTSRLPLLLGNGAQVRLLSKPPFLRPPPPCRRLFDPEGGVQLWRTYDRGQPHAVGRAGRGLVEGSRLVLSPKRAGPPTPRWVTTLCSVLLPPGCLPPRNSLI
jgi:hypothetical protein